MKVKDILKKIKDFSEEEIQTYVMPIVGKMTTRSKEEIEKSLKVKQSAKEVGIAYDLCHKLCCSLIEQLIMLEMTTLGTMIRKEQYGLPPIKEDDEYPEGGETSKEKVKVDYNSEEYRDLSNTTFDDLMKQMSNN